jgi:hypothetical protein
MFKDIKAVMDAHVDELMSIPGVVGVAIGATGSGAPSIRVLVVEDTNESRKQIPDTLDGHPVVIEVTGKIRGVPDGDDGE